MEYITHYPNNHIIVGISLNHAVTGVKVYTLSWFSLDWDDFTINWKAEWDFSANCPGSYPCNTSVNSIVVVDRGAAGEEVWIGSEKYLARLKTKIVDTYSSSTGF